VINSSENRQVHQENEMKYHQLSEVERYQIEAGIALGISLSDIAIKIKRHRSTLFREIKRNGHITQEGYLGTSAHGSYCIRRQKCKPRNKIRGNLKSYIENRIRMKWSPEQIVGRLRLEKNTSIGVETIYRYIYRDRKNEGTLWLNLRHRRSRRKRRIPHPRWPKKISRIPAETRPIEITERRRTGDFERDIIVGRKRSGYLLTLVDRKSKLVRLRKSLVLRPKHIHKVTIRSLKGLAPLSLTNDNGVEFLEHAMTANALNIPVYFTRPYASWERGTVENTNKLIRQYFPKSSNLKEISHAQIKVVQNALNQRPRKTLGFRTPNESHFEERL
jgi:IS30 family transposase